jgi:hypothetical protein
MGANGAGGHAAQNAVSAASEMPKRVGEVAVLQRGERTSSALLAGRCLRGFLLCAER